MAERTEMLKKFLCQIFSIFLWYSPLKTFNCLNQNNILGNVMLIWLQKIPEFSADYEKERLLYGLSSIISLNKNQIPECVNIPQIMKFAAKLSSDIVNLRVNQNNNQNSAENNKKNYDWGSDFKED